MRIITSCATSSASGPELLAKNRDGQTEHRSPIAPDEPGEGRLVDPSRDPTRQRPSPSSSRRYRDRCSLWPSRFLARSSSRPGPVAQDESRRRPPRRPLAAALDRAARPPDRRIRRLFSAHAQRPGGSYRIKLPPSVTSGVASGHRADAFGNGPNPPARSCRRCQARPTRVRASAAPRGSDGFESFVGSSGSSGSGMPLSIAATRSWWMISSRRRRSTCLNIKVCHERPGKGCHDEAVSDAVSHVRLLGLETGRVAVAGCRRHGGAARKTGGPGYGSPEAWDCAKPLQAGQIQRQPHRVGHQMQRQGASLLFELARAVVEKPQSRAADVVDARQVQEQGPAAAGDNPVEHGVELGGAGQTEAAEDPKLSRFAVASTVDREPPDLDRVRHPSPNPVQVVVQPGLTSTGPVRRAL